MASRDLKNNCIISNGLNISTISTNTTTVGIEIDTANYESVTFNLKLGTRTDGSYLLALTESDTSGGTFTAVSSDFLLGTPSALTVSHTSQRIGYLGKKRYVKASIISTSVTTGSTATVDVVLSHPKSSPTA